MSNRIVRKLVMVGFVLIGLVLIGFLGLQQMAQAPPVFYKDIMDMETLLDEKMRHHQAEELVGDVVQVRNDIANDPEWTFRVTDKAINSWLAEHSINELVVGLPEEVSDPRILFQTEKLKMAFRWRGPTLQSVVSIILRPEFVSVNELQIELQKVQAGLLPVAWSRFQKEIQDGLNSQGFDSNWKTVGDVSVLTIKIAPLIQSKIVEIGKITILDGEMRITGKSKSPISDAAIPNDSK